MSIHKNLTFIATTTNRVVCFQSLILSIRRIFGGDPTIIFTHQVDVLDSAILDFSHQYNVKSFATGHDSGLSYNRNFMVDMVETEFFVLCDDDFIFDTTIKLALGVELMQEHEIDILGGVYKNYNFDSSNILKSYNESCFAFNIEIDSGVLKKHEIDSSKLEVYRGLRFVECDCVNNFSIMRTERFIAEPELRWDESMKISGEHIDFFTRNKVRKFAKVFFSPDLSVLHVRRSSPSYSEMRSRRDGLRIFESKVKKVGAF